MKFFIRSIQIIFVIAIIFLSIIYFYKKNYQKTQRAEVSITSLNELSKESQGKTIKNIEKSIQNKQIDFTIKDFTLLDTQGKEFNFYNLTGKDKLVYFGFISCPVICPEILNKLIYVVDAVKKYNKPVELIFISVDTKRDNFEDMKVFVENFNSKLIGLTGSKEQIEKASQIFGAFYNQSNDPATGGINHTSFVYFISKDNKYIDVFHRDTKGDEIIKKILKNNT